MSEAPMYKKIVARTQRIGHLRPNFAKGLRGEAFQPGMTRSTVISTYA